MKKLLDFGFFKIGRWFLKNNQLQFELYKNKYQRNALYSFVCDEEVKYIGKTVQPINQRLNGYKYPGDTQKTNIRVKKLILDMMSAGHEIDIYVFIDQANLTYRGIIINLAAGIEDSLISEFCPDWNITGKITTTKPERKVGHKTVNLNQIINESLNSFSVVIGKAYYNDGFFNVRVKHSDIFGEDLSKIWIQLGDNANNLIEGYVNRTANRNGTPRIMAGKKFRHWIHENFKQGDIFRVRILKSDFINIFK
jgi:hypothetical protein